jgi:ADP-ribosylglycohydrolase
MNMNSIDPGRIHDTLLAAVIGDALGTPFDGLGKAHLHAVFHSMEGYTDPEPALKGHLDRWRKPGLYSSITQLMLLFAGALTARRRDPVSAFTGLVKDAPAVEGGVFGPFRHPGMAERGLLERLMASGGEPRALDAFPCARPLASIMPLALFIDERQGIIPLVRTAALWSRERFTVAGAVMGALVLRRVAAGPSGQEAGSMLAQGAQECGLALSDLDETSPELFALGLNPDSLIEAGRLFQAVLREAAGSRDIEAAEASIVMIANTIQKTPVTRATVNHPLCVLPYALSHAHFFRKDPGRGLFRTAMEGGSCAALASMTAMFTAASLGAEWLPGELIAQLVNRTRVKALCESLAHGNTGEAELSGFVGAEAGLAHKELQELGGRTKHFNPKTRAQPSRKKAEERIARITVESWTKLDRAKWKKEKKDHDKHRDR